MPREIGPAKVSEDSLVQNLLFAFFGHLPSYRDIGSDPDGQPRVAAKKQLCRIMSIIYAAILAHDFDENRYKRITRSFINQNFYGARFNQHYAAIESEKVNFSSKRADKIRARLVVITAVAREIFSDSPPRHDYVRVVRQQLQITKSRVEYEEQLGVFGRIERELRRIVAKPPGAISFDPDNQPLIKTKRQLLFVPHSEQEEDEPWIAGRFLLYRRTFALVNPEQSYIREYVVIDRKSFGLVIQWYTKYAPSDREVVHTGVGFLTDGGIWIIAHCENPFNRIRVLAASTAQWRRHKFNSDIMPYCTGEIITHRDENGEKVPQSRIALLKREDEGTWKDTENYFRDRVRFYSREEIESILSSSELGIIDRLGARRNLSTIGEPATPNTEKR